MFVVTFFFVKNNKICGILFRRCITDIDQFALKKHLLKILVCRNSESNNESIFGVVSRLKFKGDSIIINYPSRIMFYSVSWKITIYNKSKNLLFLKGRYWFNEKCIHHRFLNDLINVY